MTIVVEKSKENHLITYILDSFKDIEEKYHLLFKIIQKMFSFYYEITKLPPMKFQPFGK